MDWMKFQLIPPLPSTRTVIKTEDAFSCRQDMWISTTAQDLICIKKTLERKLATFTFSSSRGSGKITPRLNRALHIQALLSGQKP